MFATPYLFNFFLPLISSLIFSGFLTPVIIRLYHRFKWLDDPREHHHSKVIHTQPVPRGGGLVIFLSLLITSLLFAKLNQHTLGILLGASLLAIVGFLDDIRDLNPYFRLITCTLAALIVVGSGIGIAFITNPFGPPGSIIQLREPQLTFYFLSQVRHLWIIADLFAVIWIVWMTNIVNWSKGLDGQMPGFVAIASFFMAMFAQRFATDPSQLQVITLSAITTGAFLGFLIWNLFPQKIMPGYGGGSLAGFLLAILAILSGAKVAAMILVLALPTMDAIYTVIRRLLKGKSPVWGDRGHLHHLLLDHGWSKPQIAFFYWLITFVMGCLALQLNSTQKLFTIAMTALIVGGLILWLNLASRLHQHD
jgi:UDP-GlcNAc:undecaprenyl-phosphate GlcNAc-1-phosphate transferase